MSELHSARSFLFVPGDRPERFDKAVASGAHAIILDLEDAVAPDAKLQARLNILRYLDSVNSENILVRINDADSPYYERDLDIAQHPKLSGLILPKACKRHVSELVCELKRSVWPLVETIQGVSEVAEFAQLPNVGRLMFGTIDLSLQMGLNMEHPGGKAILDHARFKLVAASALGNIAAPIDGVFPFLENEVGLAKAAAYARASGMGGMMCIHPRQIDLIHDAFVPSAAECEWAQAVIEASSNEKSSFRFRGQMIDKPILDRARNTLGVESTE